MKHESVHAFFSRIAFELPSKTAIEVGPREVSYAELEEKSNSLANFLLANGASAGAPVAVLTEDRVEILTAVLGILKAGCVFAPLDPKIPEKRLETMISLLAPQWFITESQFLRNVNGLLKETGNSARVICFDAKDEVDPCCLDHVQVLRDYATYFNPAKPVVASNPDDPCYVYFTSGSTGQPKAIAGRLKGIDHFIRWEIKTLGLDADTRVSQMLPPSFDGSLRDMFIPLCTGGTACAPAERETVLETGKLIEWLDQQRISVIHCVPSLFRSLLNEPLTDENFKSLKYILMAGEPLLPSDVKRWTDIFGERIQLINLYGTSETTMAKFAYFVKASDQQRRSIPVGKPIEGAAAVVVDKRGRPCPAGIIGEIYIRTPYRALGYYNQPELTREAFIQNPFNNDPNDIVYKTGDLGRVLEDGNFEYLGRLDRQVKIRGNRVELSEIEDVLRGHVAVTDVAVIDREDSAGHNYLCAYVVLGSEVETEELRELVLNHLPDYMVPSAFIVMEALPRTISGKIDRQALPIPGRTRSGMHEYVAPSTDVEKALAGIWTEVLGIDQVGINDNFFQLGGHSLRATQILTRVRAALNVEVPLRSLFETPTVAAIANLIEAKLSSTALEADRISISRPELLPLSFAQQRLWFFDQLEPGSSAYNLPVAVRLNGQLDVAALERTFSEIIRRHESLRTTFSVVDNSPVQVISDSCGIPQTFIDLSALPEHERETEARMLVERESSRPFDLSRGPLLRTDLIKLSEQEHIVSLTMHHIISDGWSMSVLIREVVALYEAYTKGEESPLAELSVQYADYSVWQREHLQGEVLEGALSYWREQLAGAPRMLELPTDRPRPARQSHQGARLAFEISEELSTKLRDLSQREGVTLFMVLLAAWQLLLSRYSGQQDIVVGAAIANRNRADIENLIGFFVNTLALRVRVSADEDFLQLLARVREVTLEGYKHQDLPFERVVEELQPDRQSGSQPLFQVMFVYQNMPASSHELPGLTLGQVEMNDEAAVRSDIDFYLWEGESLRGNFIYSADLFDESTIAQMSSRLLELLEEIASAPQTLLTDLLVSAKPAPLAVSITATDDEKAPFSYHQERLWFIDQFENGNVYESSPTYHNIPLILHLNGELDKHVLESSLNAIVQRHAVLRTRFVSDEGHGCQVISPSERLELKVVQCTDLPEAMEFALNEARQPFALDEDLPISATLFRLSVTESLLLLTVHHIVADRQSLQLISAELAEIYNAQIEERSPSLSELPVQYAHYAKGQQQLIDADLEQLWFYWKWQLRGQLAALKLPEDRPRPAIHTYTAARETVTLDATIVDRLTGDDRFAAVLAAFKVLMRRYSRQDEIVVGTSATCRTQPEIANLVGPFANLVVLRSDLGGNPSFTTLVQRLQKTVEQAKSHQEMSFDKLVQLLNPEKDMSRTALFDVLFQFDDEATPVFSLGQTQAQQIDTNFGYGKYDLNFLVRRSAKGFTVTAVYNSDIYDAWNIRQMLRHFEVVIHEFANDPEQKIDDITLLCTAEEQQQLSGWNNTGATYPDKTIHQLFAEQVSRSPERVAITFGEEQLTYRELDERANRLAQYLQQQGVGPNKLVALCLSKSPEMIVSLLGVLKAGGAYLPLDPSNPADRLQFVMEDSGAAHLITTSALAGNIPVKVPATVLLDADREVIWSQPSTAPDTEAGPNDLAYCIYTSGSTGKPKGALIEHKNVVRLMVNDQLQFTFTSADVWTMFHSYSFDFSVWEMYGALLYGGRLVIVPEQVSKDPALFFDLVIDEQVTVLNQTPTAFYNFASLDQGQRLALRYVIFGGEALRPALLSEWKAARPEVKLINMYGITETTVHVTFKEIDDEHIANDTSNIGVPIPTTTTYIFDDELRLMPVGVPGEICVGGGGVCRGYLGRDELTRRKFVANPYKPEEVMYRSGDLGKLLPSGEMVYMGRSDDQVQIRGFRVEPGEVQSQLLTHPSITRAEVIAKAMHHGAVELVAYVVASGNADVSELRTHVASALPHYMVPSTFVFIDEFPLTPNGKIDRRALPEPDQMRPELGAAFVAPSTPTEEILASIWSEVLGLARVGVQDSFFELGGHSLLATQVTSRIRTVFNLELPLRNLFERPTVAELAREIDAMTAVSRPDGEVAMVRVSREEPLPLSFAQQRLWFLNQLEPDSAAYNMHTSLRISGPLNLPAFEQTIGEITRRHEILRTVFITREGEPFQVVIADEPQVLSLVDLRLIADRETEARQVATEESRRPFDLSQGPLLRMTLMRLAEEEHIVAFTMHHIISDGWSMGLLIKEMTTLYESFSRHESSPLSELSMQYADFANWQRQWLQGEVLNSQLAYWKKKLAGAQTMLELPTDRPRPVAQSYRGATTTWTLSESVSDSLKELTRSEGATLFMTLLAAFNILLQRYTNQQDILVGTDVANRNRRETEPLLGFFINQLVLRTDLSGDPTFRELLGRVREMALEAYAYQDLPFEKLVEALQPERHLSRSPLFQTKLVLQNVPTGAFELRDLTLRHLEIENNTSRIDLTLAIKDGGDYLSGSLEYSTELFDESTVRRMLAHYTTLLESIAAAPEKRISGLSVLDDEELGQLLEQSTGAKADYPKDKCIHELFAAQVEQTPNAVAVVFEDQQLTYAELNQRGNQLANYLRELGVQEEMLVGVCARRSVEMIVAVLGILKAGAAYLPLDPSYPLERIAFMLDDAQVAVLLTQEELMESLPSHWAQVVCLDSDAELIEGQSSDEPLVNANPENLAYVIYTSGSTGKPKGVMVQHAGLCNMVKAQIKEFEIESDSRVLQFASSSFDASVSEIFTAFIAGATLTLGRQESLMPGGDLEQLLREQKVTTATFPPTVLRVLNEEEFQDLKVVVAAGESLDKETAERWRKRSNGGKLIDAYGPTEATVCATMGEVRVETVSIGVPIENGEVYILDEHMQVVPTGVIGELYVGGAGIARGYLNRPELTAEKFVPNPFGSGRLYRTGDLGRWLASGEIEFLGRIDHQVKVRGYRIETGEIESMLNNHGEIASSLVIAREDVPGEKQLVAYCIPQQSERTAISGNGRMELWPSVAEFYIYDDLLYQAMTDDSLRNESYKVAINEHVPGKVVLDIGTGKDAILSRFCVEAGAAKVYAIELLEETYLKAKATIESLGLQDKITLINGNSMEIELPEKIDVCVSEIVGPIGGSEGATQIINNAWRFMKPDGVMIPERSLTKIAAITLPEDFLANPGFTNVSAQYVDKVFKQIGHRFDLRLCMRNFSKANIISDSQAFEDLDFSQQIEPEYEHTLDLLITRDENLVGFVVWLNLYTVAHEVIDILEGEYCWLPVYLPVFYPGVEVREGDRITGSVVGRFSDNNLNLDYTVSGTVQRQSGANVDFEYTTFHHEAVFQATEFHQKIFPDGGINTLTSEQPKILARNLKTYLKDFLPDYMVPSAFVMMDAFPLSPNGKVDRRALPPPESARPETERTFVAPRNATEELLAGIWSEVLRVPEVGIHDNFFELGGDSILSIQIITRANRVGLQVTTKQIFQYQTIAELATRAGSSEAEEAILDDGVCESFSMISPEDRTRVPEGIEDAYPLAMMQAGMIFHSEFTPEAPLYHSINTFTLRAPFDSEALVQAVSALAAIHEVMRTSVDLVSFSEPLQLVHSRVEVPVGVTDLRDLDDAEQEDAIARWLEEEKHNFSWGEVPMVRFHLHRRTEETFQFTFTAHHAMFDGWSDGLFLTELFRHYLSLIKDKQANTNTAVLEAPVSRFRDFVALERATLASPEARKFWQDLLSESKPTRVPRWPREQVYGEQSLQIEEVGSGVVNSIEMTLDESVSEGLRQLARRSSVPLKSVLLAAHLRVMSLISGERDVVTGLVSNGRPETVDGERVIGMFLNSLPIRLSLDGGTWEDLVTRTFKAERELLPYRRYPLSQIQRENGNRALFETCFNYVHFHVLEGVASLNDVQVLSTGGEADTNFTLMVDFNLRTQGQEIDVVVACDESKIVPAQARLIAGYYKRTLEAMAEAASGQQYKQRSILSETEQRKLLVEFNDTALSYVEVEGMHRLFEAQASRTPDATALVVGDESLTYSELNILANQLAHLLQSLGVNAEQRVGILLERSPAMIVSVLAVLKAGGCYVPLDSNAPAERLTYMMADAGLQVLLTTTALAKMLPAEERAFAMVLLDLWELEQEADENADNLSSEVSGQQLAYITYTSGSTGRPKGVMVSHASAINAYRGWEQAYELHSTSSHLQMANFAFDVFTGDLMRALFSGCKLVVCPTEFLLDPPALYALMLREGVDCAEFTPAVLRNLVQHLEETGQRLDFMRLLAAGSDTWYVREYNQIKQLCAASTRVINSYGVTEASIDSTYFESARLNLPDENLTPIGRPFANVTTHVLDADQQLAPIGTVGELYLGGAGLARGYWARPELTATKFIPDSFSKTGGGRLYRTGDLARYLENGELEFLGRADHQVKVRGYRIELGEIESELRQHEAVQEAVVVARAEAGEATRLVAYVVSATPISSAELRERLRQRLPEYMVPSAFVQLAELPLTPNGKVDRKALPEPERIASESARFVAARTPLEELIAGIWMEVLGLERVSMQENFFELGGHSLLATRVISRVRALGQVELPLRTLFESPTVAGLARRLEEAQRSQRGQALVARIEPVERRESGLPLSFAQQRLWFLDQLETGSAAYNIPAALRLRGELDQEALARTLTEIVRRHEVLRTSFTTREGEPVQLIAPAEPLALPVEDLSQLAEAEAAAHRLTEEEAQKPFDLQHGPMLRARLLRLAEQDHVLLLTMHHIVSDGWSTGVLLREAQLLYGAYSQGRPSPLPTLPIQYGDFSVWQREWLTGAVLEEQLNYWREQLQDAPTVLNLPTDFARPAVQSWRGSVETRFLPAELTGALRGLSQKASTTLYMTLLAGFQTLLSRYTGQRDIVVGTPVANRTRVELEDLIGFFVNTLVMRADLSDDPTFIALLNQTRETCLEAYLHQDLPFEKLVEELAPERSLSHSPIFQAMFVMQNKDGDEAGVADAVAASGLELQEVQSEQRTAKFDLTLVIEEKAAGLGASLEYNTDLFKGETMARMLEQFERLLQSIVNEPETVVSRLTLLTPSEEQKLQIDWNDTARDYQIEGGMHLLFEAQVERTPSATALVSEDKRFTYRELNERANSVAHHLRELGVSTEDRVGILMDRYPAMIVSLLAVLKAGGCYVPLDPQYPQERLEFMKADAGLRVLLTTRAMAEARGLEQSQLVYVDEVESENHENLSLEVSEQQLAYLIYTSGSTGVPKGVAITHGNATTFIHWASEIFDQRVLNGVLFSTSICFDLSIFELFVTLSNGGKVILAYNALQLPELAAAKQVTLINTVPSAMAELVRMRAVPESVKVVNLAGEALSKELVAEIYAKTNVETVYNLYGPSEDTTYSTFTPTTPSEPVTIGRPIANTRAYVLDQHLQCVPVGVVGELYLGGEGLARGYWARPELTATKFIPDSFSETGGGRLYRTGDLARNLENGELEFLGRADHQVKVRGYRIELGEIESELRQHEAVQEAVVVARAEAGEATRLVAYVVSATAISSAELRERLRQRLPEYMVPSAFVQLAELPLTPNGKVDRKALPEPERIASESARFVAARTPLEELIAGIWMEVLGLEKVSTQENFFELGGHSLLATRVISRVRALGQVELPLRTLFESPTVAGLARRLEEAQRSQRGRAVVARIEPVERRESGLPLSFAQQRLWFLDQLETGSAAYNIPAALRLRGELDQEALARTLTEIVRRHEVLRTSFTTREGEPVQLIAAPPVINLPVEDLSQFEEAAREAEAQRLAEEEGQTPFDLEYDPMLRARLLRLAEQEHMLLLTMHHIVSDGWSMSVLLGEAQQLYRAYREGQESPLAELEMQYGDFSVWQRGYLTEAVLEEQLEYWREQLHDLPPVLNLPTDHARSAVQSMRGNAETRTLSVTLTQGLKELSRARGATLFMTLIASFQTLLSRYSGQRDIVVGSPVANRTRVEVENLIGFFVNTLVLRAKLDDDPTFAELLDQVRTTCLDAYMHQDVPFEKLVEELAPERSLSHTPIFQVMFVIQNLADQPSSSAAFKGLQLEVVESENRSAKFDLTLVMKESGDRLAASLEYNTDLFEATTMQQLLEQFEALLNSIVSQPELPVSRLALLGREEEEQLLREWNDTRREYDIAGGMHKLFEAQVERTPAATALVCGDERLSYRELNERANRLAHYLVQSGVKPEDRVGILLERRAPMVVSQLGVLKAGGCYVPLDPQYPQERLEFMRADAGLRLLLTTRPLAEACGLEQSQLIYLEDIETQNSENLSVEMDEQQLAYLIYTSGSTGVPKGVAITHGNASTFIHWASEVFERPALDGVLFGTSICFDLSIFELFVTLSNGGKVILVDNVLQLTSLPEQVAADVTLINTVPSAMAELLRLGAVPPSVAVVNLAGEALRPDLLAGIYANTQVQQVYNLYGPSEDTTYSTFTHVPAGERVTIGRPIANTRAYVLDEELQIVRVGVVGELYLGGEGLARGYWQRPELTATKFIPDHVSGEAGARLYRTGDLARYLVNGELEFLGRGDQQVKIHGYRIELGEVESALRRHEQVRDAVVIAREARGEQRLVAYVVMAAGAALAASELRTALQKQLPEYMTPAVFVQLDEMPLTPNGKVDRKALPEPEDSHTDALETYIAPRNLIELQLAKIWEELFRVEPIGVKDNFFELGGHSLLAVRLISRIQQELGKTVPLTAVFQEPTIEHLAGLLSHDDRAGRTSHLVQLHGGSKPPLIFVHPAGGGVFSYLNLVQYLDNDQPLYALQAAGLDEDESLSQTVEAMANGYVAEIREKLSGPYYLGGWSMGGVIAFEMARQLEAAGEEVALLTLIDSFATVGEPDTDVNEVALSLGFAQDLGLRPEHVGDTSMSQFIDMSVDERLSFILQHATKQHLVPPGVELEEIARYFNVYCTNARAMSAYIPRTQNIRVALFRANEQLTNASNILPWEELVTEDFETHVIPGNHYTLLREPNVRVLAEHLRSCLVRASADRGAKVS